MKIVQNIMQACNCSEQDAKEYLQGEINNLKDLRDANDLRHSDLELACSNLGIDYDYIQYFINQLA